MVSLGDARCLVSLPPEARDNLRRDAEGLDGWSVGPTVVDPNTFVFTTTIVTPENNRIIITDFELRPNDFV